MTIIIAGGAGFIGSNLIPRLLTDHEHVVVADNFLLGNRKYIDQYFLHPNFHLYEADLSLRQSCIDLFKFSSKFCDIQELWHLAANSDIPSGIQNSDIDFRNTFLTSYELLRCLNDYSVPLFNFASSSAIYGDLGDTLLTENIGPLFPISNYGAMKLASEAQASAFAESSNLQVNLFRFPNVVGVPSTHGVILDFVRKLKASPNVLKVLGDGSQRKAYMHVSDLIDAMLLIRSLGQEARGKVLAINIGPLDEGVTVRSIAESVVGRINPAARIDYGSEARGWVGDVPQFRYSVDKLVALGWSPKLNSKQAISRAVADIAIQEGY